MEAMAESPAPQRERLATGRKAGALWWQEWCGGAGTVVPLLPCPTAEVPPAEPGVLQVAPTRRQQDWLFAGISIPPNPRQ